MTGHPNSAVVSLKVGGASISKSKQCAWVSTISGRVPRPLKRVVQAILREKVDRSFRVPADIRAGGQEKIRRAEIRLEQSPATYPPRRCPAASSTRPASPANFPAYKNSSSSTRGNSAKQKCADVNGPVPCSPFQSLKPPRNVLRRRGLSAAVAVKVAWGHGLQAKIVVQRREECKSERMLLGQSRAFRPPERNLSQIDDGSCAPGMVNWVLASHNRRRAKVLVPCS